MNRRWSGPLAIATTTLLVTSTAVPAMANPGAVAAPSLAKASIASASLPGQVAPSQTDSGVISSDLTVQKAFSKVTARGMGDAGEQEKRENRHMRHSDLQSTGRFATAGTRLTVLVPKGSPKLEIGIGLYGPYASMNGGKEVGIKKQVLGEGTNTVVAPVDGMVYLLNKTETDTSRPVMVKGGQAVPVWIKGKTTPQEFEAALQRYPDAPFVTLIADRIMGEFQRRIVDEATNRADFGKIMDEWDRYVAITNATYGLSDTATGLDWKSQQKVYISNPDTGYGYAYAEDDYIAFPISNDAGANLLANVPAKRWGLWHEIGHTYQTTQYETGSEEVTVNISALAVEKAVQGTSHLDGEGPQKSYDAFFGMPVEQRDYSANRDLFFKLMMFGQLSWAFGDNFYPQLSQEYRRLVASGVKFPSSQDDQLNEFARITSKLTDRNLAPFFEQWGIPLTQEVKDEIAQYPELTTRIWENRLSTDITVEKEL
ncbi:M60 family metallopeptidase [Haematomicrobium sanguinis]|uniref:M60 family metallopeptidase n=1 Tax=Haematomicrobium sanguinis TaxID=479106 RepID=UPI00047BE44F|nr:M60 family metallopeptidase [Haematomicrobium sanguinis]